MRRCPATRHETKPASRSTFRCLDIVGWLTARASTRSPTLRSEPRSTSRIRRRVGSASTANASTGTLCMFHPRHMPVKAHTTVTFMDDPCTTTATGLAHLIRSGQLSAVAATQAHLDRIAPRNDALTAVVSLDPDQALRAAGAADATLARGDSVGPLHGVPMTLKDGHDVAGLRTTIGAPELDRMADRDGVVAARLRAAGAVIMGHTNVAAWLADHQSCNPIFGCTSNPW